MPVNATGVGDADGLDPEERRRQIVALLGLDGERGPLGEGEAQLGGLAAPGGAPLFATPPGCRAYDRGPNRRNDHYVFLSEIGGPGCLVEYLGAPYPYSRNRIVVIDQPVTLTRELIIPAGVTLRGCGLYGIGRITVSGAAATLKSGAIKLGPDGLGSVSQPAAIEDMHINADSVAGAAVGIYGSNKRLSRVRITGFATGITSSATTTNVLLDGVQIPGLNHMMVGIRMLGKTWRVRNPFIRDTTQWGIVVDASDVLIDGGRFEANGDNQVLTPTLRGAIQVRGSDVRILANYMEQNGYATVGVEPDVTVIAVGTGVSVEDTARRVAILANFLAIDVIIFDGQAVAYQGELPNFDIESYLFLPGLAGGGPLPTLRSATVALGHSVAFNTDDDSGTNTYPARGLLVASLAAITTLP